MNKSWKRFWYKFVETGTPCYGGRATGYYEFRKQRLINILLIVCVILIAIIAFN